MPRSGSSAEYCSPCWRLQGSVAQYLQGGCSAGPGVGSRQRTQCTHTFPLRNVITWLYGAPIPRPIPLLKQSSTQEADVPWLLLHPLLKGCASLLAGGHRREVGLLLDAALPLGSHELLRLLQEVGHGYGCLASRFFGKSSLDLSRTLTLMLDLNMKINAPSPIWSIENLRFLKL